MLDPCARWAHLGEKPEYAGLLSFAGVPYTEDPRDLAGHDVAILGAAMDELVSDRPGTRSGPRAIRAASGLQGPHLETGIDPFAELRIADFGDAPVVPADPIRSHAAIETMVGDVLRAGAMPIILGGDHSIAEPNMRACAEVHGPIGLVHFDTHTDTGRIVFDTELSHGTPMYRLVESGHVAPDRYVQIGLRGYWPGREEFARQQRHGISSLFMHDIRARGIESIVQETIATVGDRPVFLSVDVDVLDPAFAPGTGTPEPGGMTSSDLLWACRTIAYELALVGMDVVEVIPTQFGSGDITALVAARAVLETLVGIAQRQRVRDAGAARAPTSELHGKPGYPSHLAARSTSELHGKPGYPSHLAARSTSELHG